MSKRWKILNTSNKIASVTQIVNVLLKNRGLTTNKQKGEFFNPIHPNDIPLNELGITQTAIDKVIDRIKLAKKNKETVIVYGDYDADGICATAILWECLYGFGLNVKPYIPNRFTDGYGINFETIKNLKIKFSNLSLIVTVDNGIVAHDAVKKAKQLGIDIIITDHHTKGNKKLNTNYLIHTTKIGGAGIAWFLAREVRKSIKKSKAEKNNRQESEQSTTYSLHSTGLELAAIGTIADQIPLVGPNRSIVKYGLEELSGTKRHGVKELFEEANITFKGQALQGVYSIGTYEVGYVIAPRINAMGRLEQGLDSLRLLCTKSPKRARELAAKLGATNKERQKVVDVVANHAQMTVGDNKLFSIVVAHDSYHEGVIGLAASDLVEKYYRPSIVISKGEHVSKASARSIPGFNIIEAIRKFSDLIDSGGGHPMAAGFSIKTSNIKKFTKDFEKYTKKVLTKSILTKSLIIDCELRLDQVAQDLFEQIKHFEPFGVGNYPPIFVTSGVEVNSIKPVGREGKHLKLKLLQNCKTFDAIFFNSSSAYSLVPNAFVDVAFSIDENVWNGNTVLQLKIKDIM